MDWTPFMKHVSLLLILLILPTSILAQTAPTISYSITQPTATPTAVTPAKATVLSNQFSYYGCNPVCSAVYAGNTYPFYNDVRWYQGPSSPFGFGVVKARFISDAPSITFPYTRSENGGLRVVCNGTELFRISPGVAGQAQGGSPSTIVISASDTNVNNYYALQWVHINAGTGVGQYRKIISGGYVSATKTATISPNWTTSPDSTSVYVIAKSPQPYVNQSNTSSPNYINVSWSGVRKTRLYDIEVDDEDFDGVEVTSTADTVAPTKPISAPICLWYGDSFSYGIGADSQYSSIANLTCSLMGWQLWNFGIGGTGYLNPGTGLALSERMFPVANSWFVSYTGGSGALIYTQNGVSTAAVSSTATATTLQTAFNTAFGTGTYYVGGGSGDYWIYGLGANGTLAAPLTLNLSGFTNGLVGATTTHYLGELAPYVPYVNGSPVPFYIVLAMGHNDTTYTNATYTTTLLASTLQGLYSSIASTYPQAKVLVVSSMLMTSLPEPPVSACSSTIIAAANSYLQPINGMAPVLDTLTVPWVTGEGYILNPTGQGNSDVLCDVDDTHPTLAGHQYLALRIAQGFTHILGN
jgi:lysophospholipase L1-like esterase